MADPTSILGFRSPRRRRKTLLGIGAAAFGVFVYLLYLMASGPDAERTATRVVENAVAALPKDRLSASDIGLAANALQRALELDPKNTAAPAAMSALAERIAAQVQGDMERGYLDQAGEILTEAAQWWPDHSEISQNGSLPWELQGAFERRALIDQARELVAAAERRLSGNSTGNEAIAEALRMLRQSLELDPRNIRASSVREDIRQDVKATVQDALRAGEAERADRLLDAIEEEWRADLELAELRRTVTSRLEEAAKAAEINQLLDLAEQRLRSDRLTTPARDSAAHYYRRVLLLDPDNDPAHQGIERIGGRYVALIRGALEDKAPSRARGLLRSLAALLPADPRIAPLGDEIEAVEREITAAAAHEEEPEAPAVRAPSPSAANESPPAPTDDEGRLWFEVKDSCVDREIRRYIESYPAGRYIEAAWRKISSCIESR